MHANCIGALTKKRFGCQRSEQARLINSDRNSGDLPNLLSVSSTDNYSCSGCGGVNGIKSLENIFVHFGSSVMLTISTGGGDSACLYVIQILEDFPR